MKIISISICFLFLFQFSLCAQQIEKISLRPASEDLRASIIQIGKTISSMEVLMDLKDTMELGYSILNEDEMRVLQPDRPWKIWMQEFVQASLGAKLSTNSTARLLLIVKELRIQKAIESKCAVRIKCEAWKAEELSDAFTVYSRIDTTILEENDPSMVLTKMLSRLLIPASPLTQKVYTAIPRAQTISMGVATNTTPPILHVQQMKDGAYFSIQEFLSNNPSVQRILAFPDSLENDRLKIYELAPDSSRTEISGFWGICMNNELYFLNNGVLVPFEKQGADFRLSAYIDPYLRTNHGRYRILLGNKPNIPIHNTLTRCTSYDIPASRIDLETGKLIF